ncbi:MAG TPA: ParB N-terminal domain-containing protein [Vicinamibacterales bacterium]|nr:ParB N-terminal domain-containing protein [Vicinamibacterales bacterium]
MTESFGEPQGISTDLETTFIAPPPEEPGGRARAREGLPAGFRMRHDAHYVDQLAGSAGHAAVRHLPVNDVDVDLGADATAPGNAELAPLIESIRQFGVLQPLLVRAHRGRFRVIAGDRRLRAAMAAGVRTVPCLVHEVDERAAHSLREAAAIAAPLTPSPEPAAAGPLADGLIAEGLIAEGLINVADTLAAAAGCAALAERGGRTLSAGIAAALAKLETARAERMALGAAALVGPPALALAPVSGATLAQRVATAAAVMRRATGVDLECRAPDEACSMIVDERFALVAILGSVDALLTLAGDVCPASLRVAIRSAGARAALLVEVSQRTTSIAAAAADRFFELAAGHPCGIGGSLQLAAASRIVQAHGGRVAMARDVPAGCTVTLVFS